MGARCKKCGTNVGCGCNLMQGYCMSCYIEIQTQKTEENNVIPTNQHTQEQKRDNNPESGEGGGEQAIVSI